MSWSWVSPRGPFGREGAARYHRGWRYHLRRWSEAQLQPENQPGVPDLPLQLPGPAQSQIGAAVGLGAIFLKSELDATAAATQAGADTTIVERSKSTSFTAPTLSLGLYGRWKLGEKWYLETDARGVYFKIENFKAGVAELGLAGRRFFSEKFAAEAGV